MCTVGKIIIAGIVIFFFVLMYACIMVSATSDEQAERMHREYLKWKRRKEKEGKWKE